MTPALITRKRVIEVALPREAINKASSREKSIRHGHPSTLHLSWGNTPGPVRHSSLPAERR
jgi:putative DNA methylase